MSWIESTKMNSTVALNTHKKILYVLNFIKLSILKKKKLHEHLLSTVVHFFEVIFEP